MKRRDKMFRGTAALGAGLAGGRVFFLPGEEMLDELKRVGARHSLVPRRKVGGERAWRWGR